MSSAPRRPPSRRPQTELVIEGEMKIKWPRPDKINGADLTTFNLIFRVFEFYENIRSDSILNRLEMDLCIPQPRGNLFPSPGLRRYLHNLLVGATPRVSPANVNRVLNEMISDIKNTIGIEGSEGETVDEMIESVVVRTHKYVLLTKTAFEFRKSQLLEAKKPVAERIDKDFIYYYCRACKDRLRDDDDNDDDNANVDANADVDANFDADADFDADDDANANAVVDANADADVDADADDYDAVAGDDVSEDDDAVSEDDDAVITLPCAHRLHQYCAKKWCYQCPKCSFPLPRRNPNQSIGSAIAGSSAGKRKKVRLSGD